MSTVRFSIITPTYNRVDLLPRAIKSVLAQTMKDWELIIVDDGSTDHTEQVAKKYLNDSRIQYIKKKNTGAADSRNVGAAHSNGEFITFLDSDDEAFPNWLETVNKYLLENTGLACAGAIKQHPDGTAIKDFPYVINYFGEKKKVKFTCGSLFIKRSLFMDIKGFDTEMPTGLLSELGYRLIQRLKDTDLDIVSIEECLVIIYLHGGPRLRNDWKSLTVDCARFVNKFYDYFIKWDKSELARNYVVIAYYNWKLKDRKESFSYLVKAIRLRPFNIKNYLRVIKYAVI
jgi:glycosyltransferase involved in cell wall biosynthesis